MGIRNAKFKGKVKIKGRPKEHAKAEIMVMNAQQRSRERADDRRRRKNLFTALDFVIVIGFVLSMYSIWVKEYVNAILFLIIGVAPLVYFIIRRVLKNKVKGKRG